MDGELPYQYDWLIGGCKKGGEDFFFSVNVAHSPYPYAEDFHREFRRHGNCVNC